MKRLNEEEERSGLSNPVLPQPSPVNTAICSSITDWALRVTSDTNISREDERLLKEPDTRIRVGADDYDL